MFHSQRYPLNLCLRNNEKYVIVDPQNQRYRPARSELDLLVKVNITLCMER